MITAEGSQTAKRETTGNPWAGFCGVVSLRPLQYSHKVKNKLDFLILISYYIDELRIFGNRFFGVTVLVSGNSVFLFRGLFW